MLRELFLLFVFKNSRGAVDGDIGHDFVVKGGSR